MWRRRGAPAARTISPPAAFCWIELLAAAYPVPPSSCSDRYLTLERRPFGSFRAAPLAVVALPETCPECSAALESFRRGGARGKSSGAEVARRKEIVGLAEHV